jgi:hypothetical protein
LARHAAQKAAQAADRAEGQPLSRSALRLWQTGSAVTDDPTLVPR